MLLDSVHGQPGRVDSGGLRTSIMAPQFDAECAKGTAERQKENNRHALPSAGASRMLQKTHVGCSFVGAKSIPHERCELSSRNTTPWSGGECPTKSHPYALRRSALHGHWCSIEAVRPLKGGLLDEDTESYDTHRHRSAPTSEI